jgi:hypothetical protein
MPCELESGNWGDNSTSQGTLKLANKPTEVKEKTLNRFSLTSLRRNQPPNTLILNF